MEENFFVGESKDVENFSEISSNTEDFYSAIQFNFDQKQYLYCFECLCSDKFRRPIEIKKCDDEDLFFRLTCLVWGACNCDLNCDSISKDGCKFEVDLESNSIVISYDDDLPNIYIAISSEDKQFIEKVFSFFENKLTSLSKTLPKEKV